RTPAWKVEVRSHRDSELDTDSGRGPGVLPGIWNPFTVASLGNWAAAGYRRDARPGRADSHPEPDSGRCPADEKTFWGNGQAGTPQAFRFPISCSGQEVRLQPSLQQIGSDARRNHPYAPGVASES